MWKKLLITGCMAFCLLGGSVLSAQPSCETKEEVTSEQLNRTKKGLDAMMKELKNNSWYQFELNKVASLATPSEQMQAYKSLAGRLISVLEIQAELEWMKPEAIQEALGIMKKSSGFDANLAEKRFNELKSLLSGGFAGIYTGDQQALDKANKALALKRELMLMSPDVNVDKMLTVKFNLGERANFVGAGSLGIQPNNWSNLSSASRKNFKAELVELSGLKSGNLQEKTVYKPAVEGSSVTDLVLNWDGKRLMFTALDTTRRWQVHEINLEGGNARQVTNIPEPDLEFFDATYLPDGRMLAISNIGYQGVPCVNGSDAVGNMVLYDPSNGDLRRLTFDQDANWHPVVMANGKVMYVRWEYTDLTHYFSRIVMHMNPDGTEQKSLYGSGSMFPNSIFDVQPLPKRTNRFVGVISGHHGVARSGRLMIFDPAKSRKEEKGMIQELPFRGRPIIPEVKDELVNGLWPQFIKPYPLTDETFLVTAKLSPYSRWGIYLVDIYDNLTLVANADDAGMIYSVPVKSTPVPPAIPDRIKPNEKEATVFIQDIYEGEGLRGVPRGQIKSFRVYAYEYAYRRTLSDHYNHGIQAGWDIKRLLGTVPVEEDGSAIFKIPANTPVSLQPLDKDGRAVQWMRSWLTGMPGEVVSCVGCHEDQNTIPVPKRVAASTRKPHELKIADGGVRSYTFKYEIQPILDRACVACHDGSKAGRPNFKDTTSVGITDWSGTRYFQKSYLAFHPYVNRQGPEADMYVMTPYEYHASTSEIVRMLERGHYNVKLTDNEWDHLTMWIDMNAPGRGEFDADPLNGYEQYGRRLELTNKYANGAGADWRKELADYASLLKSKGEIKPELPEKVAPVKHKEVKMKGWPLSADDIQKMLSKEKSLRKEIEVADGVKIAFVRVPAGKFVMGTNDGYPDQAPEFKAEVKKGFWMSEKELTNEQYNALVPDHDSRIYAQFWKDHTTPGYPANKPNQPVIRVSYEEAVNYCRMLSEKTGLNVQLPTEVQWEWACRGGSDQPFWYGAMDANFGPYENLADVQLEKMAVTGIDPQPMEKDNPWFPYYNYMPKVDTVNDGLMIPTEEYTYKANPFGLINMHGNLQEWTRSIYAPYPYNDKSQEPLEAKQVVARGGSWVDRPKDATATARRAYLPWQKVNNVGLRLIIED
ncbi:SUMF1/EgtB/PvdO family nonheme iron enzyme [Parabacteroides goldsteinii]